MQATFRTLYRLSCLSNETSQLLQKSTVLHQVSDEDALASKIQDHLCQQYLDLFQGLRLLSALEVSIHQDIQLRESLNSKDEERCFLQCYFGKSKRNLKSSLPNLLLLSCAWISMFAFCYEFFSSLQSQLAHRFHCYLFVKSHSLILV